MGFSAACCVGTLNTDKLSIYRAIGPMILMLAYMVEVNIYTIPNKCMFLNLQSEKDEKNTFKNYI